MHTKLSGEIFISLRFIRRRGILAMLSRAGFSPCCQIRFQLRAGARFRRVSRGREKFAKIFPSRGTSFDSFRIDFVRRIFSQTRPENCRLVRVRSPGCATTIVPRSCPALRGVLPAPTPSNIYGPCPLMRFIHSRRHLRQGEIVQLDCDTQCNFMLLTERNTRPTSGSRPSAIMAAPSKPSRRISRCRRRRLEYRHRPGGSAGRDPIHCHCRIRPCRAPVAFAGGGRVDVARDRRIIARSGIEISVGII